MNYDYVCIKKEDGLRLVQPKMEEPKLPEDGSWVNNDKFIEYHENINRYAFYLQGLPDIECAAGFVESGKYKADELKFNYRVYQQIKGREGKWVECNVDTYSIYMKSARRKWVSLRSEIKQDNLPITAEEVLGKYIDLWWLEHFAMKDEILLAMNAFAAAAIVAATPPSPVNK